MNKYPLVLMKDAPSYTSPYISRLKDTIAIAYVIPNINKNIKITLGVQLKYKSFSFITNVSYISFNNKFELLNYVINLVDVYKIDFVFTHDNQTSRDIVHLYQVFGKSETGSVSMLCEKDNDSMKCDSDDKITWCFG